MLVLLTVELALLAGFVYLVRESELETRALEKSKLVEEEASFLLIDLYDTCAAFTGYGLTHRESLRQRYEKSASGALQRAQTLNLLSSAGSEGTSSLGNTMERTKLFLKVIGKCEQLAADVGNPSNRILLSEILRNNVNPAFDDFVYELKTFIARHKLGEIVALESLNETKRFLFATIFFGFLLNVAIGLILIFLYSKRITSRLRVLMENTALFAQKKPLKPKLAGSDEIAELDNVFRKMAQALDEAALKEKEIEKFKQELIAIVSHDIRTPLTSVNLILDVLSANLSNSVSQADGQLLERAHGELARLIQLSNDLLDFARMQEGRIELEIEPVALESLVQSAITSVKILADAKGIVFDAHCNVASLHADRERLIQVLVNIFANAIKYSPHGGKITVNVDSLAAGVKFSVRDQGPGIKKADEQKIFERFKKSDNGQEGTGLGLAICKLVVEAHKGEIGVESEEGEGSTFWFTVPEVRAQEKTA